MADYQHITRRLFLRNTAAAGAVGATIAAPAVAEAVQPETARERAEKAWAEFSAAISEMLPEDCRLQIIGDASRNGEKAWFRADAFRREIEQVRPNVSLPVERFAGSVGIRNSGWYGPNV